MVYSQVQVWYDTHDLHEQGRLRLPRASGWDEAKEKAEAAEAAKRLQEAYIPPRPTSAFGVIAQVAETVAEAVTEAKKGDEGVDKKWGPQTNAPGLEKEGLVGSLVEVRVSDGSQYSHGSNTLSLYYIELAASLAFVLT